MKKENKGTDITLSLLLVAFVVLKLCGVIDWPWIWVLSPVWIPLIMYDLGYSNNNCIGCVKGGAGYWNKIREDFPEVFKARAEMERDIGHSILKDCFLDELPEDKGKMSEEVMEECSILCQLAIMGD